MNSGDDRNPFSFKDFSGGDRRPNSGGHIKFPDIHNPNWKGDQLPPDAEENPFSYHKFVEAGLRNFSGNMSHNNHMRMDSPDDAGYDRRQSLEEMIQAAEMLSRGRGGTGGHHIHDIFPPAPEPGEWTFNGLNGSDWLHPSNAPDFLSDGELYGEIPPPTHFYNSGLQQQSDHVRSNLSSGSPTLPDAASRSDQVADLRRRLEMSEQIAEQRAQKIASLKKELKRIREADLSDTGVFERMAAQAEANLQQTTQRAMAAESSLSALQAEVVCLHDRLASVELENARLHDQLENGGGPGSAGDLKEKCSFAAEQISAAAASAELNLKQLLAGVGSLSMLASMLEDVSKVSEIPPTPRSERDRREEKSKAESSEAGMDKLGTTVTCDASPTAKPATPRKKSSGKEPAATRVGSCKDFTESLQREPKQRRNSCEANAPPVESEDDDGLRADRVKEAWDNVEGSTAGPSHAGGSSHAGVSSHDTAKERKPSTGAKVESSPKLKRRGSNSKKPTSWR